MTELYLTLCHHIASQILNSFKCKLTAIPGCEWDHKFSVYTGFHQNIHPAIIASRENLELISTASNRSNGRECSISQEELINSVCYQSL